MTTDTEKDPKKTSQPQLIKLDRAFKMAEQWVSSMSKSAEIEKSAKVDLEGRPSRLGIGAAVPRESSFTRSSDPIEKKLVAKLQADKRKAERNAEDLTLQPAKDRNVDEDSEEELESKSRAFTKKRPPGLNSSVHAKKKPR